MNITQGKPQTPKLTVVGNTTIALSKAIQGHHGPISEITLREPNLGDWIECGEFQKTSMHIDEQGTRTMTVQPDPKSVGNWIQRLSGVPMSVFAHMEYRDFQKVYRELQRLTAEEVGDAGKLADAISDLWLICGVAPHQIERMSLRRFWWWYFLAVRHYERRESNREIEGSLV